MSTYLKTSKWFVILESIALVFGQFARINLTEAVYFYLIEFIILIHIFFVLFELIKSGKILEYFKRTLSLKAVKTGLIWISFILTVYLLQISSFSFAENLRALGYIIRIFNFILFALIVIPNTSTEYLRVAVRLIAYSLPLICLIQYIFWPDLRVLGMSGWDPHMYRAVGTILDPPILGSILGVLLVFSIESDCHSIKNLAKQNFWHSKIGGYSFLTYILLLAVILLFSRSSWLAILVATSVYIFMWRGLPKSLLWFAIFILLIWLAPHSVPAGIDLESSKIGRISTVTSRGTEIRQGLQAFWKSPVWGIGYNRVREYKSKVSSGSYKNIQSNHSGSAFHSFWVTQLATTGIVGVGLLLWLFSIMLKGYPKLAYYIFIPAFIGLFDNTLFHPLLLFPLLLVSSIAISKR